MLSVKVKIDGLADAVVRSLAAYSAEATEGLKKEVKKAAKEAVAELKSTSPKDSGDYAAGWKTKTAFENSSDIRVTVYNSKAPQLTHLLENGHAKVAGGRVAGQPHIGPAEAHAAEMLEDKAKVVFKG